MPVLFTWESELRAIAEEAARWTVETGGDLFGLWEPTPMVYLATRTGPGAVRDRAHFRLDVDYLRTLSAKLAADWGLRYFGDWHSHHRLGLIGPSSGDRRRILRLATRNAFAAMSEIIVTLDGEDGDLPLVRLHPWVYPIVEEASDPVLAALAVAPGESPVREALVARGDLPEQELGRWSEIPPGRIRAGTEREPLFPSVEAPADSWVRERVLLHARRALEEASGGVVEEHPTRFGMILAVLVDELRLMGIAVSGTWPHEILQVNWIDRQRQKSAPLAVATPRTILAPQELVVLYRTVCDLKKGTTDVDDGPA